MWRLVEQGSMEVGLNRVFTVGVHLQHPVQIRIHYSDSENVCVRLNGLLWQGKKKTPKKDNSQREIMIWCWGWVGNSGTKWTLHGFMASYLKM